MAGRLDPRRSLPIDKPLNEAEHPMPHPGSGVYLALAHMPKLFRTLVVIAVAALIAWGLQPPAQPYPIHLNVNGRVPVILLLGPGTLFVGLCVFVAAIALLCFRKWGLWLGGVTLLAALLVYGLLATVGFNAIQTVAARALLVLSALAWLGCLLLSRYPSVAARFKHVR